MRVLHITTDYVTTQSGTGAHVQFLGNALRQAGVEVSVAAMPILGGGRAPGHDDVELHPQIGPEIVWHEQGGDGLVDGVPAAEWTVARQSQFNLGLVAGIDRDQHFDLIHFHGFRPAQAAVALGRIFDAPLVMTKHGSVEGIRLGKDVVVESSGGWSPFSGWTPFVLEYVRAVDHFGLTHADRVIAVSDATRQDLLDRADIAAKTVVIRNGADLPECTDDCPTWQSDRPGVTLGLVGRLVPQKGVDVAIEALALLGRDDVRLRIAGAGPMLGPLREGAEKLGVAKRVEFAGSLGRDLLHRFLHESDLVLAPSRWDAFPQSVCQAQALGKLVVGTAVDGIVEQITDRRSGLLCPPSDARALADAIEWALDHPEDSRRIAAAAGNLATSDYSWQTIAARTRTLYEEVISEFKRPRAQRG